VKCSTYCEALEVPGLFSFSWLRIDLWVKMDEFRISIMESRRYERRPFVKPIRYYLPASHLEKLKKIDCDGVAVDISEGGLGMITDFPLTRGDIVFFEPEIKADDITAKSSIVRWALEIETNKYRVGLEFITDRTSIV